MEPHLSPPPYEDLVFTCFLRLESTITERSHLMKYRRPLVLLVFLHLESTITNHNGQWATKKKGVKTFSCCSECIRNRTRVCRTLSGPREALFEQRGKSVFPLGTRGVQWFHFETTHTGRILKVFRGQYAEEKTGPEDLYAAENGQVPSHLLCPGRIGSC